MQNNLDKLSEIELLQLHASIIDELKRRNVVRIKNNPIGDYTKWLAAKALKLKLATNSSAGYDGEDANGIKYQINGRRVTSGNKPTQLSATRNLVGNDLDVLVAVQISYEVIEEYAEYRKHVSGHIRICGENY